VTKDYKRGEHGAGWNDERVELATKLFKEGLSASQIAARLGGVSRNAVIGKLNRAGVTTKRARVYSPSKQAKPNNHIWRAAKAAKKTAAMLKSPKAVKLDLSELRRIEAEMNAAPPGVGLARKGIVDLGAHDCRWPIGDPLQTDFHFCGLTKLDGIAYCEFHARKAFQAPMRRTGDWVDMQRKQRERKLA